MANSVDRNATATHPNVQLWDRLYQEQKDEWTNLAVDKELLKFHDEVTEGKAGLSILVPMCGKSKVLLSFAEEGHSVVGIEWSEPAVKQFFEENSIPYNYKR